jgi:hypothetical protein
MRYRGSYRFLVAALGSAARDARRAWTIAPIMFAISAYEPNAHGGWRLVSRRRYARADRLRRKAHSAFAVFKRSLLVRLAADISIPRIGSEGLLGNLLHVLEVVHRVRPDACVHVDWQLTGRERGFRYGRLGENVWTRLFRTLGPQLSAPAHAHGFIDFAFWGVGRLHLTGSALERHRRAYHATASRWVEVTSPRVNQEVADLFDRSLRDRYCIGIHRRVANVRVANLHPDGLVPSLDAFVSSARAEIAAAGREDWMIVLATDDAEAVAGFRAAFGDRLTVREPVQRTTADRAEVHSQDWGQLSTADAEDALADTLLLSKCAVLIHTAGSISAVASLLNPSMRLVRVVASASERPTLTPVDDH